MMSRCSSATGLTTRSAGAWCFPTRPSKTSPLMTRRARKRSVSISPIGTTSPFIIADKELSPPGTASPVSRARRCCSLLQERARELGGEVAFSYGGCQRRRTRHGIRSRHRCGRFEFEDPQRICPRLRPGDRNAQEQICLARHPPEIRRCFYLHLRGDRAPLQLAADAYQFDADTATFIVECSEATWRKFDFACDEPGQIVPDLRADFRKVSRRPSADVERDAFARLGLAEFPARSVRDLVAWTTSC